MNKEAKEKLLKQKKNNRLLASDYRKMLQDKLEKACVDNGGHEFWDWQEYAAYNLFGEALYTHRRECEVCGYREYKREDTNEQKR